MVELIHDLLKSLKTGNRASEFITSIYKYDVKVHISIVIAYCNVTCGFGTRDGRRWLK